MSHMSFGREIASVLLKVVAVVLTVVLLGGIVGVLSYGFMSVSDGSCNIAVMPIDGVIMPFGSGIQYPEFTTTPRDVRDFLGMATTDPFIQGILFEVNSPGGTPVASETIATAIAELELPNAALIGDMAASGGYLIAAAADTIIASPMSDVGSIGVTMSYVEESEKNKEEGLTFVPLSTGKFKDSGNPNKPLTDEERALFERDLQAVHEAFVAKVAGYRNLTTEAVSALADGSTMAGVRAKEMQLVDTLGDRNQAKAFFAEKLGIDPSEVAFCEYNALLSGL
jgi:protease IV